MRADPLRLVTLTDRYLPRWMSNTLPLATASVQAVLHSDEGRQAYMGCKTLERQALCLHGLQAFTAESLPIPLMIHLWGVPS
jgi:hypothetical protein